MNTLSAPSTVAQTIPVRIPAASLRTCAGRFLVIAVVCVAMFLPALYFSGCKTQDVPAHALVTAVQTVDSAMKGWANWVALGKATPDQQTAVFHAYQTYQLAEDAAQQALLVTINNHDDPTWTKASEALTAAQTDLLKLVDQFTKPKP